MVNLPISLRLEGNWVTQGTLQLIKCSGSPVLVSLDPPRSMFSLSLQVNMEATLTIRRLAAIQRISMRCWLIGIILSIGSSSASLVKLRADGRRFALTQAAARKENAEKSPEEKVRAEEERREKGRALLA
jgi:hypothetical protein